MTANTAPAPTDLDLWRQFADAYKGYINARMNILAHADAPVALVRAALHDPAQRDAALDVAALLPIEERQQLLMELLALASAVHGYTEAARKIILSLPHDWLRANITAYAEPILAHEDYEEYRCLLTLYGDLDRALAEQLARRAAKHVDDDIREAGEDFLKQFAAAGP